MGEMIRPEIPINSDFRGRPKREPKKAKNYNNSIIRCLTRK